MDDRTLKVLEYNKIIDMLAEHTVSNLGREIVLALRPGNNIYEIKEWLQETSEAVEILLKKGSVPLEGIYDVRTPLKKAEIGSIIENSELLKISDTLSSVRKLKSFMKEKGDSSYPIIEDLISLLVELKSIEVSINNVVLNEEEISDNASPELSSIRRKIKDTHIRIRDKMNSMVTSVSYQKYLQEQIITIRSDRYVIPVKQEFRSNVPGVVHDTSASGATLYIEPMAIVEMNNDLKQLKIKENDEVRRILLQLSAQISEKNQEIKTNLKILTTLDFIFAKAKFSLNYNCIEPLINDLGRISLKKARHPLLDPKTVVPIDIHLGDTFNILVITGPNTGGKTVSLKTVGLLSLMAQSGIHIPAAYRSEISIFDKVFADIGDEQSIEQSLSTFSSHMKNIAYILNEITEKSLVLFDELGAGTDPTEGAALAMSILELLRNKKIKTVATTHYSELKAYALTTKGLSNGSVEFDIQTLKPTFRLSIGMPGKSNAFEISKKLGLNEAIIERAKDFITKDKIKFEDIITNLEESKKKADEERDISERLRYETEQIKKEADRKLQKLESQRDSIIRKAYEEAKEIIDKQKEAINEMIKDLKEAADKETKEKLSAAEKVRLRIKNVENDMQAKSSDILFGRRHKPPKKLKLGDTVRIIRLDQKGYVATSPDENGNLVVQAGILKVNVNINDLQLEKDEDTVKKVTTKYTNIARSKSSALPLELDLRGKTLDEALFDVDKYLDDAFLSRIKNVTIIHGKGTGVLRSGIMQLLKDHPNVKSYRLGGYHEGGVGATIVELK